MSKVPATPPSAGLIRRLASLAYESLLVGAILFALGFVLLPLTSAPGRARELTRLTPLASAGSFAFFFAVFGAYCTWLWTGGRQTLPMRTWHLALRTANGAAPGAPQALLRYLAWWIGPVLAIVAWLVLKPYGYQRWAIAALAMNYAWALFDSDHRFLHDRIAGTRIVAA